MVHRDIKNHRKDVTHKLTTYIAKNHSDTVIEDLCVEGMMRNHKLARSIANSNFGEIRRQLEYKGIKYGSNIFIANRFFASSKTCSHCGHVKEHFSLKERTFICEECGLVIDRDENAARNLEKLLYLDYKEFSKLIINCSKKNYNAMRKRFLDYKNKTTMSSIGIACGDLKVSDLNKSVRVNETGIEHQIYS